VTRLYGGRGGEDQLRDFAEAGGGED